MVHDLTDRQQGAILIIVALVVCLVADLMGDRGGSFWVEGAFATAGYGVCLRYRGDR